MAASALDFSKTNRFLLALPPADYGLLARHLSPFPLTQGTVLHHADADIEHIYFPETGMVSLVVTMHDGTMRETAVIGRSGIICANAMLGSRYIVGSAIVQIAGVASRVTVGHFQGVAQQSHAIRELAIRYNDLLMANVQQSVACIAVHELERRLCRWLLESHDCCDAEATLPFTQESLSKMLGVRRTSVTIAARRLKDEGLIRYSRAQIHIINRAALEVRACECYITIRDRVDKLFPQVPYQQRENSRLV